MGRDVPEGKGNAERGGKKREEGKEGVRKMIEAGEKMSSLSQLADAELGARWCPHPLSAGGGGEEGGVPGPGAGGGGGVSQFNPPSSQFESSPLFLFLFLSTPSLSSLVDVFVPFYVAFVLAVLYTPSTRRMLGPASPNLSSPAERFSQHLPRSPSQPSPVASATATASGVGKQPKTRSRAGSATPPPPSSFSASSSSFSPPPPQLAWGGSFNSACLWCPGPALLAPARPPPPGRPPPSRGLPAPMDGSSRHAKNLVDAPPPFGVDVVFRRRRTSASRSEPRAGAGGGGGGYRPPTKAVRGAESRACPPPRSGDGAADARNE